MPDRPWTELLALYPEGHPVRSAIKWADMDTVPVLAGVLVEELERMVLAMGARNTEAELAFVEENDRLWDAIDHLWAVMPVETVKLLRQERPELVELAQHAHHRMSHEQRMMR